MVHVNLKKYPYHIAGALASGIAFYELVPRAVNYLENSSILFQGSDQIRTLGNLVDRCVSWVPEAVCASLGAALIVGAYELANKYVIPELPDIEFTITRKRNAENRQ